MTTLLEQPKQSLRKDQSPHQASVPMAVRLEAVPGDHPLAFPGDLIAVMAFAAFAVLLLIVHLLELLASWLS